jgi:hypothetical protein
MVDWSKSGMKKARAKSRDRSATCPVCGRRRNVDQQKKLRATEAIWFKREAAYYEAGSPFYPLVDGMRGLAISGQREWFWACDGCIRGRRALTANITKQVLGLGTPFAAYVDRPFRCSDCDTPSVFTASEQQHWYETLGFLIWVYPNQCAPCRAKRRRKRRANRALAEALAGLDTRDPTQLEAVARLYDEIGAAAKATVYRSRAKNRRALSK